MFSRLRKLWVLTLAFVCALSSCNLIFTGGDGSDIPLDSVSGRAVAFSIDLTTIYSNEFGAITLWADEKRKTPLDLTTIISVPGHTIVSSGYANGIYLNVSPPLVVANNETVHFDTSKVFYGSSGSAPVSGNVYKFQFNTPIVPITYH